MPLLNASMPSTGTAPPSINQQTQIGTEGMSSLPAGFKSNRDEPLASSASGSNDAHPSKGPASPPMAKSYKLPAQDTPPYPPMVPVAMPDSPFLARIYELTCRWVQEEWFIIDAIKRDTTRSGRASLQAIKESRLTLDNLAKRLENISQATLLRELKKLNAPPPGEIIRVTRLTFAKHLLIHTRLLVREVALRAGYDNQRHFAEMFLREFKCRPSDFRRSHVKQTALKPTRPPKPKS
ncbi:helix-turn-helix transcriptional regulator [Hyphomicrobium sp.]|uniref:helix-turn-helix transcriptional regulator n=1 Tax=Hyphomicrobium sp. TaxID=82 RepID=UPI0025BADC3C|nr:helix-turn-helix transcriptional regulator [Hyphomicrobium sp.]